MAAGWAVTLAFLLLPHWFKITAIVSLLRSSGLTWSWICIVRRHLNEVNQIAHRPKLQTIISIASAHPFAPRFYETVLLRLDLIILFGSLHYPKKITSLKSYLVLDCNSNSHLLCQWYFSVDLLFSIKKLEFLSSYQKAYLCNIL